MNRLDLELLLRRPSRLAWLAAALLAAALALHLGASAGLEAEIEATRQQLAELHLPAAAAAPAALQLSPLEQRYQAFRQVLSEGRDLNLVVAGIFAEAEKQGITLAQGEYKLSTETPGGFVSYQVSLPVRATYPQLRRLVDAILQSKPGLALAEISFKRDSIGAATPEASLRLMLFLKEGGS